MNKKVLVTGANGQLGKTIEELYLENDLSLDFVFLSKEQLDITVEEKIETCFKINKFDYCINCAAYTNVEQAEKTPEIAYKINAEGVKNLAKICKETETILIHISTDYVFDGEKNEPYTTNDIPNPINEYGKSKLQGEKYIQDLLEKYFIVRTSWLYSKKYGKNFYRSIINKALKKQEIKVTIEQIGCPTDTTSLSKYIVSLIKKDLSYGIHHYCDKKVMTWHDFAESILIDNNLLIKTRLNKTENYSTFARRPKNSVLQKNNK